MNTTRRQIARVIDGAVADAISSHPEFFALGRSRNARVSIVKRVTGAVHGYLRQKELASPKGAAGADPARVRPAVVRGCAPQRDASESRDGFCTEARTRERRRG